VRTLRLVARAAPAPLNPAGGVRRDGRGADRPAAPGGARRHRVQHGPTAIPLANQALRGLRARDAETLAARTLRARTAAEIEELLTTFIAARNSNALKF
jgi:hypothetical protein